MAEENNNSQDFRVSVESKKPLAETQGVVENTSQYPRALEKPLKSRRSYLMESKKCRGYPREIIKKC